MSMEDSRVAASAPASAARPRGAAAPEPRVVRRRVLGLAWPVIGENLLETLLGIVDTLLVAGLGAVAIAGVGAGLQVMFFVLAALAALSIGSSVLVAQEFGAGNLASASRLARQSLLWSLLFSIPLALAGLLLAEPIVSFFGAAPEVTRIAAEYVRVSMGTVVVLVTLFLGGGVLRGAGDSRTPMVVTGIANVVNVALTYGLIYGQLGLPRLGAVGSAWGTFLARALAVALLLTVLWRGRNGVRIGGRIAGGWRPDLGVARQVVHLGIPAAVEQFLISAAFFALTILVARLGTEVLAAQRISVTALSFAFLPGIGFAIAATTLVGQSVGARRILEGAAAARVATWWAVLWMGGMALLLFVFAYPAMRLFSDDPEVVRIGAEGLRVVALVQPFWAVLFVQAGATRGTGDTRFPLAVTGVGIWSAVLLAFILLETVGGGLLAVWGAFLATSPPMAWLHWRHFRGRVRQVRAAEHAPRPEPLREAEEPPATGHGAPA
jgi:putative MATE family efflux protein